MKLRYLLALMLVLLFGMPVEAKLYFIRVKFGDTSYQYQATRSVYVFDNGWAGSIYDPAPPTWKDFYNTTQEYPDDQFDAKWYPSRIFTFDFLVPSAHDHKDPMAEAEKSDIVKNLRAAGWTIRCFYYARDTLSNETNYCIASALCPDGYGVFLDEGLPFSRTD